MKSNNKPDSLVAACFGMAASFLIIAALSGCGGGAGSGGFDSGEGSDVANGTVSANGNIFTISSFKRGLGEGKAQFSMIENVSTGAIAASSANATATLDTDATHATEGNRSVDVNFIAPATYLLGLMVDNTGLADWTPYRYVHFDVKTGASAFNGKVVVQSKDTWVGCEATGSVAANSTGTLTLDMNTCSAANLDKTLVQRLQLQIDTGTAAGHFYVDNVRLEKDTTPPPPPPASDVLTLADFESGLGSFVGMDDWGGSARATGSVALDTVAANASQGVQSATATVSTVVTAGAKYGLGVAGNGGVADWSAYRFLKADITTTTGNFNGAVAASFGSSYKYCGSSWTWINAGTSSVTLVADLSKCGLTAADLADVKRFQVYSDQVGTFNVDNVRLEKAGTDMADATTSTDGNTYTISSFGAGVGAFSMIENASPAIAASSANATVTLDTVAADATQGTQSVDVNFIAPAANKLGLKFDNSGVTDWTPYRYARFDVTNNGASDFEGTVIVQSGTVAGDWSLWCEKASGKVQGGHTGTITLDLNSCGATINKAIVQRLQLRIESATAAGHYFIDNVRLTKN